MKAKKIIRLAMVLALLVSLFAVAAPPVAAFGHATTALALDVTSGPVGTLVTATVTIDVAATAPTAWTAIATGDGGPVTLTGASILTGSFTDTATFTVALTPFAMGVNTVTATVGTISGSATFTIPIPPGSPESLSGTPSRGTVTYTTTNPAEIQVGDTIQVVGTDALGWPLANVGLTVKWYEGDVSTKPSVVVDTVPAMVLTAETLDCSPECAYSFSFKVPPSVAGDHLLRVTDGINNGNVTITVAPELKRSPSSGTKGTEITVTANGFSKSTGVIIYDDPDNDGDITTCGDDGAPTPAPIACDVDPILPAYNYKALSAKASLITDSLGTAVGTVTGNGDYTFVARDGKGVESGTFAAPSGANQKFALKAKLTLSPTEGLPDTRVTIKGTQFSTSCILDNPQDPTVSPAGGWGGTANLTLVDSVGDAFTFSPACPAGTSSFEIHDGSTITFKVPVGTVAGLYTVSITDGAKTASATFNVLGRSLTLSKTEGPRGVKLLVTGSGMSTVEGKIEADNLLIGSTSLNAADINIDSAGSFSYEVTIPEEAATGGNTIKATDNNLRVAKATYTVVKPTAAVNPTEQVKGGDVVVTGSGYAPNKSGTIKGAAVKDGSVSFSTDAAGNFQRLVTVGDNASTGNNVLTVADDLNNSNTVTLEVPSAALELSSTSVRPGDQITATGTSLDGNTAVGIYADDALQGNLLVGTVYTDSQGNFTATFTVPNLAEGFAVIYANTGGAGGTTGSRSIEVMKKLETASVALASISNQVTIMWGFEAADQTWLKYDPAAPAVSDLTKLEKGKGYWINVSEAVDLVYGLGTYSLSTGWNLIGWLGT